MRYDVGSLFETVAIYIDRLFLVSDRGKKYILVAMTTSVNGSKLTRYQMNNIITVVHSGVG